MTTYAAGLVQYIRRQKLLGQGGFGWSAGTMVDSTMVETRNTGSRHHQSERKLCGNFPLICENCMKVVLKLCENWVETVWKLYGNLVETVRNFYGNCVEILHWKGCSWAAERPSSAVIAKQWELWLGSQLVVLSQQNGISSKSLQTWRERKDIESRISGF